MNRQDKSAASFSVDPAGRESRPIKVRILDKDVQIGCKSGDEDALLQAAAHVNASMRELRTRKPSSSVEKIAIVTAINTAHDLLRARELSGNDGASALQGTRSAPTGNAGGSDVPVESEQGQPPESDATDPPHAESADAANGHTGDEHEATESSITSRLKTLNDEMAAILEEQQK